MVYSRNSVYSVDLLVDRFGLHFNIAITTGKLSRLLIYAHTMPKENFEENNRDLAAVKDTKASVWVELGIILSKQQTFK